MLRQLGSRLAAQSPRHAEWRVAQLAKYSNTAALYKGRKGGMKQSMALPKQGWSKKQIKRKKAARGRQELVREPKKEANVKATMEKKFESKQFQKLITDTERLVDSMVPSMLPDGIGEIAFAERERARLAPPINEELFLSNLREQAKGRMLPSGADGPTLLASSSSAANKTLSEPIEGEIVPQEQQQGISVDKSKFEAKLDNDNVIMQDLRKAEGEIVLMPEQLYEVPGSPAPADITPSNVNSFNVRRALIAFANNKDLAKIDETLNLMEVVGMKRDIDLYEELLAAHREAGDYDAVAKRFDELMTHDDIVPTPAAWTALVDAKVKLEGPDAGNAVIERLAKQRLPTPIDMHNSVLEGLILEKRNLEAHKFWVKMHWEEDPLNIESFETILKLSIKTNRFEQAMWYFDELQTLGLEPREKTFERMIRASAEAPFWVKGYENSIHDVLYAMEGKELVPTTRIYNTIIYAYGRAGDPNAAEYYFWEMRKKGIAVDETTYSNLFFAYSIGCSIGAKDYGYRGRWQKPREPEPDEMSQARLDIGARRVAEIISGQYYQENLHPERGNRRQRVDTLKSMADHLAPDEENTQVEDEILQEARKVREMQLKYGPNFEICHTGNGRYKAVQLPDGVIAKTLQAKHPRGELEIYQQELLEAGKLEAVTKEEKKQLVEYKKLQRASLKDSGLGSWKELIRDGRSLKPEETKSEKKRRIQQERQKELELLEEYEKFQKMTAKMTRKQAEIADANIGNEEKAFLRQFKRDRVHMARQFREEGIENAATARADEILESGYRQKAGNDDDYILTEGERRRMNRATAETDRGDEEESDGDEADGDDVDEDDADMKNVEDRYNDMMRGHLKPNAALPASSSTDPATAPPTGDMQKGRKRRPLVPKRVVSDEHTSLSESASSQPSNHFDEDEDEDEDDEAEGNYNTAVLTEPLKSPTPASSSSPSMHAQDALEDEEHEEHEEYEAVATRASDGTVMLDTRKMMEELESELDADVPSEEDLGEDDIPLPGDLEAKLGQLSMGAASMDEQSLQQLMTGLHSDIHNIHSGRESPDSANHADTHTNAKAKSQPRSKNIQAQSVTAAREPGPERQIDEDEARKLESMLIIDSPNLDYNPDDLTLKSMKDPYAELRDEELNNLVKQRSRPEFSEAMNDILDLVDQDPYSLDPIDNPKNITMEALRDPDNPVNWDFVDQNWAMVYFGKAPEPNYEVEAMPLRRHRSIMKANMYMKEMLHRGIKPDVVTLTNYLSVYCESIRYVDEAKELFDKFEEMGVEPDQKTYRAMIRMYVRAKQPQEALLMKEQCIEKGIVPDAMSYGYLIDTLTNREMIVEAIKMLEEAADNGIKPPEKYVKKLRGRLRNLGVTHPNMPACPTQWAKDLMARRKLSAHNKSRRNIAPVQSKMFAGKKR